MSPLPKGYEPHEIPADYTGPLFLAGQMRAYARAELEACIKILESIHENRKYTDNYALFYANILRERL